MTYPRVLIDTKKILNNVQVLVKMAEKDGIEIAGITKGFCANKEVAKAYIDGGVKYLADSRISNLKKLEEFKIPKILLRLPMVSNVEDVVSYSNISLNSEVETIKALSQAALKLNKIHGIILMADLGDLREGYFIDEELLSAVDKIRDLKGINLLGIGVNFTCYGGVIPNKDLTNKLVTINNKVRERYGIKLDIISGGNSSSIYLLGNKSLDGINNLRLGESLLFGTESAFGHRIPDTYNDAFTLEVEVIEVKHKPSVPTEKIGKDAFGKTPIFNDRGVRKKIICAVGKQDTDFDTMFPYDKELIILGGSSDHLILDGSDSNIEYKVGDIIKFNLHYVSVLRLMTSPYVEKVIL